MGGSPSPIIEDAVQQKSAEQNVATMLTVLDRKLSKHLSSRERERRERQQIVDMMALWIEVGTKVKGSGYPSDIGLVWNVTPPNAHTPMDVRQELRHHLSLLQTALSKHNTDEIRTAFFDVQDLMFRYVYDYRQKLKALGGNHIQIFQDWIKPLQKRAPAFGY